MKTVKIYLKMSKYLRKLKSAYLRPEEDKTLNLKYSLQTFNCGDGYKAGTCHEFKTNDPSDIKLLLDIIPRFRLGVKFTEITDNSFIFESPNKHIQIFFFRICRYMRDPKIKKILENTIMINKQKVPIQNAFLLAFYYTWRNCDRGYYDNNRDILFDPGYKYPQSHENARYLNKPFKTLKEFKECFYVEKNNIQYSHIYIHHLKTKQERIEFKKLVHNQEFKKAEKYLLNVFK
jgi:hypothetical protein